MLHLFSIRRSLGIPHTIFQHYYLGTFISFAMKNPRRLCDKLEGAFQIRHLVIFYIIEEMNNPPGLQELAKQVGLNIKKLKSGFKEYYGSPVFTFLLNYKMELAKTLLIEQQFNVNEIASKLGYSTSSHFISAFKKKYGITPKQYSIS